MKIKRSEKEVIDSIRKYIEENDMVSVSNICDNCKVGFPKIYYYIDIILKRKSYLIRKVKIGDSSFYVYGKS